MLDVIPPLPTGSVLLGGRGLLHAQPTQRLPIMRSQLFGNRNRSNSNSSDTSQETEDDRDSHVQTSVDLQVGYSNQQQRTQMPFPRLRRDTSDQQNQHTISDNTDVYDSDSDDDNDPYFGTWNAREDAAQLRRQQAINEISRTFRCMSLDCMPEPDEVGVPTLIRQPAYTTVETIQLRCTCCGQLDDVEIYY